MVEVLSLVNFNNKKRIEYLEQSFATFYKYKYDVRHVVIDGSDELGEQVEYYKKFNVEYHHQPKKTYARRLKNGLNLLKNDYFLFYPDDFAWIFHFPLEDAIAECRANKIKELKLTCRGMDWFSELNPKVVPWFQDNQVITGEKLKLAGNLYISNTITFFRDFHEQISLACNIINTDFLKGILKLVPDSAYSPGKVEKWAYLILAVRPYNVAYYKMWIPAFHFIDLDIEGHQWANKFKTSLRTENFSIYNSHFNGEKG